MSERLINNFHEIKLFIERSDLLQLSNCYLKIQNLVGNNKKVPPDLLKEFSNYFKDPNRVDEKLIKPEVEKLTAKVLDYFEKHDEYKFQGTYIIPSFQPPPILGHTAKIKKTKANYSLEQCVYNALWAYFANNTINDKKDAMKFFLKEIQAYSVVLNKSHKTNLTLYKKYVMAACIAHVIGYKLDNNNYKTNEMFFQATRNALKKKIN